MLGCGTVNINVPTSGKAFYPCVTVEGSRLREGMREEEKVQTTTCLYNHLMAEAPQHLSFHFSLLNSKPYKLFGKI